MPPDPHQKISLTWADVLLIAMVLLLGMLAWRGGERFVAPRFARPQPSKDSFVTKHQVPARRAELVAAERNLALRVERLREQRLEDMRHRAVTAAYETLYPRLRDTTLGAAPAEVRSGYLNARMLASATQGFLHALEIDVARQDSLVARSQNLLRSAERAAAGDLQAASKRHASERRWLNLASGLVLASAMTALLWLASPRLARRLDLPIHPRLAFGVGGTLLLLLVANHMFHRAGAATAGTALVLGWLAYVVIRHPATANELEAQDESTDR